MNPELDKRKELERRKKLRLLQVRQQSKEFADKLREKIKGELDNQREKYLKAENKLKQEKHLQELCQLKELYDKCLKSIGEGHKEAAKQLDLNLKKQAELAEISAKAVERGAKALKKHKEEEAIQKHKTELPVKQKRATRNKENLRAFYISSLPKHTENNGPLSVSPSKPTNRDAGLQETRRVLEEIPTNVTGCETKSSNVQKQSSPEKLNELRKDLNAEEKVESRKQSLPEVGVSVTKPEDHLSNTSSAKDCSCEYIVCACHRSPGELRRCSSESRISCEKVRDFEEPIRKKVRNRSFSPRSVRTLNYFDGGNVYESNQQSNVRVTHHSSSPKRTEEEPVLNTSERPVSKPSADELKKRTDERSAKALRKEQLKKDFQQLIQNFKKLTREKSVISSKTKGKLRVYSSERDILERNESKQKKLNDAFEKLPHSVKSSKTISTGIQKTAQIQTDDSSPPTLNLAVCQTNMIRKVVSTDEISISSTPTTHRGNKRPRSTHSSPRSTQQQSSTTYDKSPPNVVVKKDPSGDVHITVKVSEVLGGKSKSSSPSSGSSYLSPPSAITPSQQRLLDDLLRQVNKGTIGCELKKYIKELLSMSRESVEALRGGRTNYGPQFTPGGGSQSPLIDQDLEQDFAKLNQLAEVYAEKVNTLVNMYEQMSSSPSTPPYIDPVRAPPSMTTPSPQFVSPRSMMSPSPQPRQGVCPSPATVPQSRQVICPSPADVPQSQQVICPSPANVQCLPQPQQGICPDPCVPPSRTLSSQRVAPRSTRSPSPQPRQGICPAATPSPRSSGYGRTPQPRYIPLSPRPQWTPEQYQETLHNKPMIHPERTQTPAPTYIPSFPVPCSPWGSPHIPSVAPPGSAGSGIPIAAGRQPRATRSPPLPPQPLPQPYTRPATPLKRPPQPMVHHPTPHRPRRPQPTRAHPDVGTSRTTPRPTPCPPDEPQYRQVRFPPEPETPAVTRAPQTPGGLESINESPEFANVSSGSSELNELLFGGIPGVAVPTREEFAANAARAACLPPVASPIPEGWDMEAFFWEKYNQLGLGGEEPSRTSSSPGAGNFDEGITGTGGTPFDGFDFGQEDFGDMGFGNEDFNNIDALLQEEARPEDAVDIPEDFPPLTDVFGPGFDWETANMNEPSWPSSFPGGGIQGHSMSSDGGSLVLDTSFDTSALQGPVNPDRLNAIRCKLSNICNDQYREIIEMLQKDASQHETVYGKLLQKATSDPFLDPNATLAPLGSPAGSYPGSPPAARYVSPPPTRSGNPAFSECGRTPPGDLRIQDISLGDSSPAYQSPEFDLDAQFCDFSDPYSNIESLKLLINNQKQRQ